MGLQRGPVGLARELEIEGHPHVAIGVGAPELDNEVFELQNRAGRSHGIGSRVLALSRALPRFAAPALAVTAFLALGGLAVLSAGRGLECRGGGATRLWLAQQDHPQHRAHEHGVSDEDGGNELAGFFGRLGCRLFLVLKVSWAMAEFLHQAPSAKSVPE